jgi:Ubiquitin carboxyl-terminal hydrolase/UBA/TS-N domain
MFNFKRAAVILLLQTARGGTDAISNLIAMGYDADTAMAALIATRYSLQRALDLIQANADAERKRELAAAAAGAEAVAQAAAVVNLMGFDRQSAQAALTAANAAADLAIRLFETAQPRVINVAFKAHAEAPKAANPQAKHSKAKAASEAESAAVAQIVEFGFEAGEALQALRAAKGKVEVAVDKLADKAAKAKVTPQELPRTPEEARMLLMGFSRAEAGLALAASGNDVVQATSNLAVAASTLTEHANLRTSAEAEPRLIGLQNRSIDCWMNSALQALVRLPQAANLPAQIANLGDMADPTLRALRPVVELMQRPAGAAIGRNGLNAYVKREALAALRYSLLRPSTPLPTAWSLGVQHDPRDFINLVFQNLPDAAFTAASTFELETVLTPVGQPEASRVLPSEPGHVMEVRFPGTLTEAYAAATAARRTTFPTDEFSLVEMLAQRFNPQGEVLGDNVTLSSERMVRAPEVLIIQIPRTGIVVIPPALPGADATTRNFKMSNTVHFPERGLEVGGRTYTLHGVIYHSGATNAGGHYHASVRQGEDFYNYNDSIVTPLSKGTSLMNSGAAQNHAAVLFYVVDASVDVAGSESA